MVGARGNDAIGDSVASENARQRQNIWWRIGNVVEPGEHDEVSGIGTEFLNAVQHTRMKRMKDASVTEDERNDRCEICPKL